MCVPVCDFRDYIVSYLQTTGFKNPMLIVSYIRRVLATGYEAINFIKYLKGVHSNSCSYFKYK